MSTHSLTPIAPASGYRRLTMVNLIPGPLRPRTSRSNSQGANKFIEPQRIGSLRSACVLKDTHVCVRPFQEADQAAV